MRKSGEVRHGIVAESSRAGNAPSSCNRLLRHSTDNVPTWGFSFGREREERGGGGEGLNITFGGHPRSMLYCPTRDVQTSV